MPNDMIAEEVSAPRNREQEPEPEMVDFVIPERERTTTAEDFLTSMDDDDEEIPREERLRYRIHERDADAELTISEYSNLAYNKVIKVYFNGKEVVNWGKLVINDSYIEVKQQSGVIGWRDVVNGQEDYRTPAEVRAHVTD